MNYRVCLVQVRHTLVQVRRTLVQVRLSVIVPNLIWDPE